jgi:hypothetical protein
MVRTCRILTLGNSGKIYRSLRSQQELPQQKLMRARFERFGLSVLFRTNSFPLLGLIESQDARLISPPPKAAHNQPTF